MGTTRLSPLVRVELRYSDEQPPDAEREWILTDADAAKVVSQLIGTCVQEVVIVLHIDAKNRLVSYHEVGRGGVSACPVLLREVFAGAVHTSAHGIVLAHNHPSGETAPSAEDVELTNRVIDAGELLGIPLIDHVIVVRGGAHFSFRGNGMLSSKRSGPPGGSGLHASGGT